MPSPLCFAVLGVWLPWVWGFLLVFACAQEVGVCSVAQAQIVF